MEGKRISTIRLAVLT